jgi:7-keto-8-aminopelargonate synthetase-like enzyme
MVEQLRRNGTILRDALAGHGLDVGASRTQIIPVVVGEATRAMALCERALEGRAFAQAIRPPTVPEGTSRLRLSAMANHRADELCAAADVIAHAAEELDIVARGLEQRISRASRLPRAA